MVHVRIHPKSESTRAEGYITSWRRTKSTLAGASYGILRVGKEFIFTFTFTYSLTVGVVGAPCMTSQPVSSTALWDLANSRPVHFLTLSSKLSFFFCLPCLLRSFTVACKMVLARPHDGETCPYHVILRLFTMVKGLLVL